MKQVLHDSAQDRPEAPKSHAKNPERPVIMIQLTGLRLTACLMFVLLIGIGAGTLVANRAGAAPNPLTQLNMRTDVPSPMTLSAAFNTAASAVEPSVVHITTLDMDTDGEA